MACRSVKILAPVMGLAFVRVQKMEEYNWLCPDETFKFGIKRVNCRDEVIVNMKTSKTTVVQVCRPNCTSKKVRERRTTERF